MDMLAKKSLKISESQLFTLFWFLEQRISKILSCNIILILICRTEFYIIVGTNNISECAILCLIFWPSSAFLTEKSCWPRHHLAINPASTSWELLSWVAIFWKTTNAWNFLISVPQFAWERSLLNMFSELLLLESDSPSEISDGETANQQPAFVRFITSWHCMWLVSHFFSYLFLFNIVFTF